MPDPAFAAKPRTDLYGGLFWIALGGLIVVASWQMDRLEQQGATPWSAPGLWPGIVGALLAILGGCLVWRSVGRARIAGWQAGRDRGAVLVPASRFGLAAALFFVYALLLVGRGLPFWLGTALFVMAYVFVFRRANRSDDGESTADRRDAFLAIVCGVATALAVTLVFEQLFYVRLP